MNLKPHLELATGGTRLLNFIIDYFLKIVAGIGIFILSEVLGITDLFHELRKPGLGKYFAGMVWTFMYYVFFEGLFAQSPGKMITRTEVVTDEGKRPELNTVMLRTLCRFIPFNAFSFLFNADAIGWHDSLSKTRVVRKRM
jgi:uncharacterized RDD family membrane protein YckC